MTTYPNAGIHRMPNELLGEVFILYRQSIQEPTPNRPRARTPFKWTRIMLVCRRWRSVAIATSTLWTAIHILGNKRFTFGPATKVVTKTQDEIMQQFYLAYSRSAKAPLELLFAQKSFAVAALPTLNAEAERIQSLTLPDEEPRETSTGILPSLLQLWLPVLIELDILYGSGSKDRLERHAVRPPRHGNIIPSLFPSLRILRVSHWTLEETSLDIFPQLTCLDLRFCAFKGHPTSFISLLDVLEKCTQLNELQLHLVLGTLTDITQPPPGRVVHLQKLHKLVVRDAPSLAHLILSHVSVPAAINVRVVGVLATYDPDFSIERTMRSLIPTPRTNIPLLGTVTHGAVENFEGNLALRFFRGDPSADDDVPDAMPKITLKILASPRQNLEDLDGCFDAIRDVFISAPLTSLTIEGDTGAPQMISTDPWTDFLGDFTTLKELEVSGMGPALHIIRALGLPVDYPEDLLPAAAPDTPICPGLQRLMIQYLDYSPGFVEALFGVLHRRANYGLPQLKCLEFRLVATASSDCCESFEMYEDQISSLVENFDWSMQTSDSP